MVARRIREASPRCKKWMEEQNQIIIKREEEELRLAKENERKWLECEDEAQKEWKALQMKLNLKKEKQERQNTLIREEWEKEQLRLKRIEDDKLKNIEQKQRQEVILMKQIDDFVNNGGEIPENLQNIMETNPNKPICQFFKKTNACRFGDICSRNHQRPGVSTVLLILNFYSHISLEQLGENEYGTDSLEYEVRETYNHFKEFFYDVYPEFKKYGEVVQFKVCCNREPHLRGNVYIEYQNIRDAVKCYITFQGRWYAGKQLNVEFCGITSWRSAICGKTNLI